MSTVATKITARKRNRFLKSLAESGNVSVACRYAAVTRGAIYKHRMSNPKFRASWKDAVTRSIDVLEKEARRRAVIGVEEPVFYKGDVCGHVQKYSDVLLIFLLKGLRPKKYRDNWNGQLAIDAKLDVTATARQITPGDLDAAERQIALLRAKGVSLDSPAPLEPVVAQLEEDEDKDDA